MAKDRFGLSVETDLNKILYGSNTKKKKRKSLTPAQRLFIWEHPKLYGRTCSICHQRITKQSDLELDHTIAHSKSGTKLALAHKDCNRIKGSGSLGKVQKRLGLKQTKKARVRTKTKSTKRRTRQPTLFQMSNKQAKDLRKLVGGF